MGDDARIEARSSKLEARASRFYLRVSIRCASTCAASPSFDNDKRNFEFYDTGPLKRGIAFTGKLYFYRRFGGLNQVFGHIDAVLIRVKGL